MKKEEIENAARILSEIKDLLNELESALKSINASKASAAKIKIMDLQLQMRKML